jgi:hypothetical protein
MRPSAKSKKGKGDEEELSVRLIDPSANTDDTDALTGEEKKAAEIVPFATLFRFATTTEKFMLFVAVVAATGAGTLTVCAAVCMIAALLALCLEGRASDSDGVPCVSHCSRCSSPSC